MDNPDIETESVSGPRPVRSFTDLDTTDSRLRATLPCGSTRTSLIDVHVNPVRQDS